MTNKTQAERIASLEVTMKTQTAAIERMEETLESLVALRNQGIGAFWLATGLVGSGIVGGVATIWHWVKG